MNIVARNHCDILIRNGYVCTMDSQRTIHPSGAIALSSNNIVAVGPDREIAAKWQATETIDAKGGIVHPGFVEAHLHITANLSRGQFGRDAAKQTASGPNYADWKAALNADDEKVATELGSLELLRHGFTTFVEPGSAFEPDMIAAGARAVGIRCTLADPYLWDDMGLMDIIGGLKSGALLDRAPPTRARVAKVLGGQLHRNCDINDTVHGHIAIYGEGTASDELMQMGKDAADTAGTILNFHLGFDLKLAEAMEARWQCSRFEYLSNRGILGSNVTLVHMNMIKDVDIAPLEASHPSLVWCPLGYVARGTGRQIRTRLPEMMKRGLNVALGTDSARNCTVGDAGFLALHLGGEAGVTLRADDVMSMLTMAGAKAAGLSSRIGSIEPRKRADIVIRDSRIIEMQPAFDPVFQLIAVAHGPSANTVLVNGRIVLNNHQSTLIDEDDVSFRARHSAISIAQRLGLRA